MDVQLFDFNLEEECLSGEEPVPMSIEPVSMSIPFSEDLDVEDFRLSNNSLLGNNNDTEAFEFGLPTSISRLPQINSIAMCTSVTPPTNTAPEILSSPIQETYSEECFLQPTESSVQPSSLPMVSIPSIPSTEVQKGAIPSGIPGPPPPPPPPPIPPSMVHKAQHKMSSIESNNDNYQEEEVGFKADSSSDETMEEHFSLH